MKPADLSSGSSATFVEKLLALAPSMIGPERVAEIRDVFARRDLKA